MHMSLSLEKRYLFGVIALEYTTPPTVPQVGGLRVALILEELLNGLRSSLILLLMK